MFVAYVIVTVLTAIATAYATYLGLTRHSSVIDTADRVNVSQSLMLPFSVLLGAATVGLLLGFAVPLIGTVTAAGLVLYFTGAVTAHLRARDFQLGNAAAFLTLSVASLAVGLAEHGLW